MADDANTTTAAVPSDLTPEQQLFKDVAEGKVSPNDALKSLTPEGKLAGKYDTPAALQEGVQNAVAKLLEKGDTKAVEQLYATLQRSLSGAPVAEAPPAVPAVEGEPLKKLDPEAKKAQADKPAVDLASLDKEWRETGKVSDASLQALTKAGIPKQYVEAYIAGQQALQQQYIGKLAQQVGGVEAYNGLIDWANENLPADKLTQYETLMSNPATAEAAVLALHGLRQKTVGFTPAQGKVSNGTPAGPTGDVFNSDVEMQYAMRQIVDRGQPPTEWAAFQAKVARSIQAGKL